jgi:hypothetical protein
MPALSTQTAHYSNPLLPHWDQLYWSLTTRPTVLSTLAPGLSDENLGNEFRAFADVQICPNDTTPGRVSEHYVEKK